MGVVFKIFKIMVNTGRFSLTKGFAAKRFRVPKTRYIKIILSALLISSFFWVSAQPTNISYRIKDAKDSVYILGYHLDNQRLVFDSLPNTQEGLLAIRSEERMTPGLYFIYGPESGFYQELIINESSFEVTTDGSYTGTRVFSSRENDLFLHFQKMSFSIKKTLTENSQLLSQKNGKDSLLIVEKIAALKAELNQLRDSLRSEEPDLLVSKILTLLAPIEIDEKQYEDLDAESKKKKRYQEYRRKYRERLDFKEEGLIRTPLLKGNAMQYLTEVIPQIPDSIINELDEILQPNENDSLIFRYWLSTFSDYYEKSKIMGMQAVLVHLLDTYYLSDKAFWITEEARNKIAQQVKLMKPNQVGKIAPTLLLSDTSNSRMSPLELPAEYLVLYFFDPDCGVCKKRTPILKEHYASIKELSGEVVAINIASESEKWKQYIKEQKLSWINLADLTYQSSFREDYNVKSVPFVFVLDQNRKIIARKLQVDQIADFLSNYQKALGSN